jgi:hypothetical protein
MAVRLRGCSRPVERHDRRHGEACAELDKIKPMFMLAEASQLDLHQQAFDMTYGWDTLEPLKDTAKGKAA